MPPLTEMQTAMAQYLTSPPGPDVPEPLRALLPAGTAHAERRFAIYKNNVYARLVDALRDTFPAVARLVGDEFFRYAAVDYIARTPPKPEPLTHYGRAFPDFLAAFAPAADIAYLADVARLEMLYLESYHAADAVTQDTAALESGNENTHPVLHPSARFLTSPFQISRIWELNRSDTDFADIDLPLEREYLLIIRPNRQVEVRRVPLATYVALLAFAEGANIREARATAVSADPHFDFAQHYTRLSATGVFVKPSTKDHST